ncbi:esterase family protein [Paenibacillus rhizovicinus]|uniref:Esterase family protein n=1 Tax=Paenibacillus rhizovicinus TaxID=2704463 RepID=A0A6C0NVJ6_9BACL|nr:alpha/beta hydrolase-fold protein [Paenibacillus rhizovicinus]QHW29946.1 esterase family protein [Paenibacillus rhizovicinus]
MAVLQTTFFSSALGMTSSLTAVLPQDAAPGEKFPVLFLLHGLSDDHTTWLRLTTLELLLQNRRLAVIMPNVHRSFYSDMAHGLKYWTYVSEELPKVARALFPISDRREDTFVAGQSMGGYGAFKLALSKPEQFAAAASLSGALDVRALRVLFTSGEYGDIFGDVNDGAHKDDLFAIAETAARSGEPVPKLYQCCGTEDFLYEDGLRFLRHAGKLGLEVDYEEEPGLHEWGYWNVKLPRILDWLPMEKR